MGPRPAAVVGCDTQSFYGCDASGQGGNAAALVSAAPFLSLSRKHLP